MNRRRLNRHKVPTFTEMAAAALVDHSNEVFELIRKDQVSTMTIRRMIAVTRETLDHLEASLPAEPAKEPTE